MLGVFIVWFYPPQILVARYFRVQGGTLGFVKLALTHREFFTPL